MIVNSRKPLSFQIRALATPWPSWAITHTQMDVLAHSNQDAYSCQMAVGRHVLIYRCFGNNGTFLGEVLEAGSHEWRCDNALAPPERSSGARKRTKTAA